MVGVFVRRCNLRGGPLFVFFERGIFAQFMMKIHYIHTKIRC